MSLRQTLIALLALCSALLSTGCLCRHAILPDLTVPHRVANDTCIDALVRRPDGAMQIECIKVRAGWWVAAPEALGLPE